MAIMLDGTKLSPKIQKVVTRPNTSIATIESALSPKAFTAKSKTISGTKTTIPYVLQSAVKAIETKSPVLQFPGKLTESQKTAITKATEIKYGQAVVSSPANQRMIALLRTRAIVGQIASKGMELAPKGTMDYVYNADETNAFLRDAYNALYAQQEQWTAKQTEYQGRLSEMSTELAKGTYQAGVYQEQLGGLTSKYEELRQKYNELLQNPPANGDLFGGIGEFINKYGLWIALGIGAIILLPPILNIFGGKK